MICYVCRAPTKANSKYCSLHGQIIVGFAEQGARARAFRRAFEKKTGAILCHYTGQPLDLTDPDDPWYATCDHKIPGKKGGLVACAAWVNRMKTQLSESEFGRIIRALADGTFTSTTIKFRYWLPVVLLKMAPVPLPTVPAPHFCNVCDKKCDPSIYCPRCRRLIFSHPSDHVLLARTLKAAYVKDRDAFVCQYTKIILDPSNNKSPFFPVYDHRIPRKEGDLALCAAFVNAMKGSLSDVEFFAAVKELARHFAGAPFDRDAVTFRYWTKEVGAIG